jgi:ABC-2 type transport system ATP-binding protein
VTDYALSATRAAAIPPGTGTPVPEGRASTPALSFDRVTKIYRKGKMALSELSFEVAPGTTTALLGPNGAGKSTAIKILVGLTQATSGDVAIGGRPFSADRRPFQRMVGYVGQFTSVEVTATAYQNLQIQAALFRLPAAQRRQRIDYLSHLFELDRFSDKRAMSLSGGQKRRLDIAMALVHDPKILIMDEPTVSLDVEGEREVWQHLVATKQEQELTLLFSTHYLDQADRYADNILFINHGKLVTAGTPAQLKELVEGDTITLACADSNAAALGYQLIDPLEFVETVSVQGANVIVVAKDGPRVVARLVSQLQEAGIAVEQVQVSRPSLNDVYTLLTGDDFGAVDAAGRPAPKPQFGRFY